LSAQGAKVIVTGRNPETLASAKKTLTGVVVLPSDSGDLAAAQALGEQIKPLRIISTELSSSIAGSVALAGASIYSATKAAVISLGKTLAVELAPRGVRVNVLSPGPIDTPIIKKVGLPADQQKAFEETIVAKSLFKRFGTSDEVARAARFLLSEDSSNITGTELIIDGGVRLN
jgi:NADP-dependent 3-hydroxy acid dehydrogenase YdfG